MKFSRRSLFGSGAATLFAGALSFPAFSQNKKSGQKPKNIIFCVADGMAIQVVTMADQYQQSVHGHRSYWSTLLDEEYATSGFQATRSLNSLVTDSAAASSAWGSGRRIWNGQINMFPDKTKLRPLTSLMSEAGVRCGLVTTTTMTHATPAGFAVNCFQRDLEGLIAEEYLQSGVDVLLGGGGKFFSPTLRSDKKDLFAEFGKAGYTVAKTRKELLEMGNAKKILGIFHDTHMPFTVDQMHNAEYQATKPTLAEMTKSAIDNLKDSPKGFLLQIEGGKVDHGAHGNDLAAMLYDQMAFEEAVKVAVEFALKDKDTLVIITADHACGGPSLNGAGEEYIESTAGLQRLSGMKSSYAPIFEAIGKTPTSAQVRDTIQDKLSITFTEAEAEGVVSAVKGASPFALSTFQKTPNAALAMALGNHTKVTWTSGNHTSDHVLVTAVGPGSEEMAGVTPNTRFFEIMLAAKDLKWTNPEMTFEEAQKHRPKPKVALDAELRRLYASHEECEYAFAE